VTGRDIFVKEQASVARLFCDSAAFCCQLETSRSKKKHGTRDTEPAQISAPLAATDGEARDMD
jgi:hypothetical protein